MAYKNNFLQLTWGGPYFTEDIWVNGLHIIDTAQDVVNDVTGAFNPTVLERLALRIQVAHTNGQGMSDKALLSWFKLAVIGTDGKYVGEPILKDIVDVAGGRSGAMYPQLATAVSLRTDKKRGPAAYGRFYAPVALPVGDDGRVSLSDQQDFAQHMQILISDMNDELDSNAMAGRFRIGNVSKVGSGAQETVTGVFVGDLVDTQRRRRNRLQENHKGYAV